MSEVAAAASVKDWTISDRESFSASWNRANVLNLMSGATGAAEYKTITQRTAFYNWFDQIREIQGHGIKWCAAAWIVASQMKNLDDGIKMAMLRAWTEAARISYAMDGIPPEGIADVNTLIAFGNAGNKAIFDDVFSRLQGAFVRGLKGQVIVGDEANAWDRDTLQNEQFKVVQPLYDRFAGQDKALQYMLADMASGNGLFTVSLLTCPKFQGDIMRPGDRYNHGLNVVVPFYNKFKQAIDQGRASRQVSKPDPSAGGMVSAATTL